MIGSNLRGHLLAGFALVVVIAWIAASVRIDAKTNLVWQAGDGFRFASLAVPATGQAGFTLLNPIDTGVSSSNRLTDAMVANNRLYEIGSGVALGDVDGDGWVDIYFCRLEGDNVLYRNLGDWKFEDITTAAGVACNSRPVACSRTPMETATSICW